ncbi:MAG: hypothetical protein NZT92_17705 [Abditibacteriales bacterium]|nr:hypothetical protein [Abditibacteriales bacterium]
MRQLTNLSQAMTDAVSYDAWGNVLSSSGATVNPYKFVGVWVTTPIAIVG